MIATEEPSIAMFNLDDGQEFWRSPLAAPIHDLAISPRRQDQRSVLRLSACDDGINLFERRGNG